MGQAIRITPELEEIRRRALKLDDTASPFLIHRKPNRERREWMEGKPHWTYVNPQYLSKAFEIARDAALDKNGHTRYAQLTAAQRPTFHEIRGSGARLYRRGRRCDHGSTLSETGPFPARHLRAPGSD